MKVTYGLLISIVLMACGSPRFDASDTHVVGTSQRRSDAGAWDSTVAITRYGRINCTGILVTPELVVTAAHCLEMGSDWSQSLRVYRGEGVEGGRVRGQYRVLRGERHPDYGLGNVWGTADIAYLILADPVTDATLIPVAAGVDELRQVLRLGNASKLLGFGIFDNANRRLGIKHEADAAVGRASAQEVYLGNSQGDACGGDSGGPVFGQLASGAWRVFGVSSRGPSPCGSDRFPGVWSSIAAHACWLEKASGQRLHAAVDMCADGAAVELRAGGSFTANCRASRKTGKSRRTFEVLDAVRREQLGLESGGGVDCLALDAWAHQQRRLDLSRSMIDDLSPLATLNQLEELDVEDNFIADVGALAGLSRLRSLRLGWNNIRDFGALATQEAAGMHVRGRSLQQEHWQPRLRQSAFLRACLELERNGDDSPLAASILAIKRAACTGRECSCYTAQDELQLARILDLTGQKMASVELLRDFSNIQQLKFSCAHGVDLSPLRDLENLRHLEVTGTTPVEGSVLEELSEAGVRIVTERKP